MNSPAERERIAREVWERAYVAYAIERCADDSAGALTAATERAVAIIRAALDAAAQGGEQ